MTRLNELIEIDRRFQNSINLQLDLKNEEKVKRYIPTRSSNAILEHYLENVDEKVEGSDYCGKEKATILIGPYGKGKSHLLLVLLDQLSKRERPFLPVIVSGTFHDINQAFMVGLMEGLQRENLQDIVPDSTYDKAIDVIKGWKENYPEAYDNFLFELSQTGTKVDSFVRELGKFNQGTLSVFKKIYSKLTYGGVFNPILETEIKTLYQNVALKLSSEHGYDGIFIVFDEFSKYIEGHEIETFERDMGVIQEMCEAANTSTNPQIHITFVAHKSIKEYGNALPKSKLNAFTGIEGRIKEVRFVVSSQNNYELIQHAIKKKEDISAHVSKHAKDSYNIQSFKSLFNEDDFMKIVAEGCYPLMPLTASLLLQISEKVAQNERSIFTYLANDEKGTLLNHVATCTTEKDFSVTADVVYDYFVNLFREDATQAAVHAEWLKADYALSLCKSVEERKMIKVIALLLMVRKHNELPVNRMVLSYALNITEGKCQKVLKALEEKKIIVLKPQTKAYVFKNNVGIDIEKEITEVMAKNVSRLDVASVISEVSELDYVMPKKHNQEYKITRYFQYVYMTADQFVKLPDAETLFTEKFADGKIIAIIRDENFDEEEFRQKCEVITDSRMIVLLPQDAIGCVQILRKYVAVKTLLNDKTFLEDNVVIEQELHIYEEDLVYEINQELSRVYQLENKNVEVIFLDSQIETMVEKASSMNDIVSAVCDFYYKETPKVNNELINRQQISSQNRKARNKIIDMILTEQDCSVLEHGTSPEATIYRATMMNTGVFNQKRTVDEGCQKTLDIIDAFVRSCDGEKKSFNELYQSLMGRNIGARKGVIPIYMAFILSKLQDMPILYLDEKEVELEAGIFDNIEENPSHYYIYVEHETAAKETYLKKLEGMFIDEEKDNLASRRKRLSIIVRGMQDWYRSLPQVTLNTTITPDQVNEEDFKKIKEFRKVFRKMDLNPRDILFDKIGKIIESEDYRTVGEQVSWIKEKMDSHFPMLRTQVSNQIRVEFHMKEKDSLSAGLKDWYGSQSDMAKTYLLGNKVTNFMNYISDIKTNDEDEITEKIVKIILDIYLEDWNDDSFEQFVKELKNVHEDIEQIGHEEVDTDKSNHIVVSHGDEKIEKYYDSDNDDSTSYFFKNAIEDALEEFGDTLEMNQKVAVLVETLEKLMKM